MRSITRTVATSIGALATVLALGAGTAAAQDSPPAVDDRTFEREDPPAVDTDGGGTEVLGAQTVQGQALPTTGGGVGPEVYLGAGLTIAGLGLAIGARRRSERLGTQA